MAPGEEIWVFWGVGIVYLALERAHKTESCTSFLPLEIRGKWVRAEKKCLLSGRAKEKEGRWKRKWKMKEIPPFHFPPFACLCANFAFAGKMRDEKQ